MTRFWSLLVCFGTLFLWISSPAASTPAASPSKQGWVNVQPKVVRKFPKRMIKMMRTMRKARMKRAASGKPARTGRPPFAGRQTQRVQLNGRKSVSAQKAFVNPIQQMNEVQKARYQKWLGRLMAPCCPNQVLSSHDSPKATKARRDLQQRILRNETDAAIRTSSQLSYGEGVFSIPPHQDIIWFPIVGSILILFILIFLVQRWNRRGQVSSSQEAVLSMEEQGEFLDE